MKLALTMMAFGVSILGTLQGLYIPFVASYGGQWASSRSFAGRGGGGPSLGQYSDAFLPQVNYYPLIISGYVLSLAIVFLAILYMYARNRFRQVVGALVLFCALPFIWAVIASFVGFNYDKCFVPSASYGCENPTQVIASRLIFHFALMVAAFGLAFLLMKMWPRSKQTKRPQ